MGTNPGVCAGVCALQIFRVDGAEMECVRACAGDPFVHPGGVGQCWRVLIRDCRAALWLRGPLQEAAPPQPRGAGMEPYITCVLVVSRAECACALARPLYPFGGVLFMWTGGLLARAGWLQLAIASSTGPNTVGFVGSFLDALGVLAKPRKGPKRPQCGQSGCGVAASGPEWPISAWIASRMVARALPCCGF